MIFYTIAKNVVKVIDFFMFKTTIRGVENLPKEGSYVLCSNHRTFYDPVSIALRIKRQVHFLAKIELYKNPILKRILLGLDTIPVDRQKVSISTLKDCLQVLKNDEVLGIFPEGTRVKSDEPRLKPMDGFVMFATKTESPIIPVHIEGEFKFRAHFDIIIGEPIELTEYYKKRLKPEEMSELSKKIMDIIYDLK